MKRRKTCARGHVFYKSSDCPTCPRCEALRKPGAGFLSELASPARRALEGAGLDTLPRLAGTTEERVMQLHGMGPNAMTKLRTNLRKSGLSFRRG